MSAAIKLVGPIGATGPSGANVDERPFAGLTIGQWRALMREEIALASAPANTCALLTQAELASALKISDRALRTLRNEPGFPELRITPDCPRYVLSAVVAWLEARAT